MAEIVDIVHRLSFEIQGQGLDNVLNNLKAQGVALGEATKKVDELKKQLEALGSGGDKSLKDKLENGLKKVTAEQERLNKSIAESISKNKQVNDEYLKETSLIGGLVLRMDEFKKSRIAATDINEIKYYNQEIKALEDHIKRIMTYGTRPITISVAQPTINSNVLAPNTAAFNNIRQSAGMPQIQQLQQATGLIQRLNAQVDSLNKKKLLATSETELAGINRQLRQTQDELKRVNALGNASGSGINGRSILGTIGSGLVQGLGIGAGIGLVSQAAGFIKEIAEDAGRLAAEMEGVRPAFEAINQPDLLNKLRESTKGTISDLELMKKAVDFDNLGLPVERLGTALAFARVTAQQTGKSVEYLANSIVNGISRNSLPILDNLGLSATDIRDKMKEGGTVGDAAFALIEERLASTSSEMITFIDRQDQLTAKIENQKAAWGDTYNSAKSYLKDLGLDILNFAGAFASTADLSASYLITKTTGAAATTTEILKNNATIQAEMQNRRLMADFEYVNTFKRFTEDIKGLDANQLFERESLARAHYEKLREFAKANYDTDSDYFKNYMNDIKTAFNRTSKEINQSINFENVNFGRLSELTKSQLESVQTSLQGSLSDVLPTDIKAIATYQRNLSLVNKELDKFNAKRATAVKSAASTDPYNLAKQANEDYEIQLKLNDAELKSSQQVLMSLRQELALKLESNSYNSEQIKVIEKRINDEVKLFEAIRKRRELEIEMMVAQRNLSTAEQFNRQGDILRFTDKITKIEANQLELRAQTVKIRADIDIQPLKTTYEGLEDIDTLIRQGTEAQGKESEAFLDRTWKSIISKRKDAYNKEKEIEKERAQAFQEAYNQTYSALYDISANYYNTQIQLIDNEINYRNSRLEEARELARRGNTEVLMEEEENIRRLTREREVAARRQMQLNQAIAASQQIVNAAEAIGAVLQAAKGDPYTLAARVIAAAASIAAAIALVSSAISPSSGTGFKDGGYTGDGKSTDVAGVVHKKEFVHTAEKTAQHFDLFSAIHEGRKITSSMLKGLSIDIPELKMGKSMTVINNNSNYQANDFNSLRKGLKNVELAVANLSFNVDTRIDENGINQIVNAQNIKNRQKWN